MYRVYINKAGNFRAVKVGTDPESANIATSFESAYWHQFQQELRVRLHNDSQTSSKIRDETTDKKGRQSGANLL